MESKIFEFFKDFLASGPIEMLQQCILYVGLVQFEEALLVNGNGQGKKARRGECLYCCHRQFPRFSSKKLKFREGTRCMCVEIPRLYLVDWATPLSLFCLARDGAQSPGNRIKTSNGLMNRLAGWWIRSLSFCCCQLTQPHISWSSWRLTLLSCLLSSAPRLALLTLRRQDHHRNVAAIIFLAWPVQNIVSIDRINFFRVFTTIWNALERCDFSNIVPSISGANNSMTEGPLRRR